MNSETGGGNSRGQQAAGPMAVPPRGWLAITKRAFGELKYDHVQVVSAGVAFYFFLALFPALAATISIYGLVVDPAQVEQQINQLSSALPQQAQDVLGDAFSEIAGKSSQSLGIGLIISVLLSLWGAKKATAALFEGINIAYHELDKRGFIRKNLVQLGFTLGAVLVLIISMVLVVMVPALLESLGLPRWLELTVDLARWPLLALLVVMALGLIYQKAPDRTQARISWITPGAVVATALWLIGSGLFSFYVNNFGSFDKTYGSFAAIIVLLLWLFLTAFVIIFGAEVNAESEHQTAADTTDGEGKPLGERGAYYADHVADRH